MTTIDIIDIYYPTLDEDPFKDLSDMKKHWFLFADILCLLLKDEMINELPTQKSRVGMGYSEEGAEIALTPSEVGSDRSVSFSQELNDLFMLLINKGRSMDVVLPLQRVIDTQLSDFEILAVMLAYVAANNRKYEQQYADLFYNAEKGVSPLTVGLCMDMARFCLKEADPSSLMSPDSYVNTVLFEREYDIHKKEGMSRELILRETVVGSVESDRPVLSSLAPYGTFLPQVSDDETICLKGVCDEIKKSLERSGVTELCGDDGSGRRFLLSAAAEDRPVISVDMKLLTESVAEDIMDECIGELIFLSNSCDCVPYLFCQGEPTRYGRTLRRFFSGLYGSVPSFFIGTTKPIPDDIIGGCADAVFRITVPEITSHDQKTLWKEAAKANGLSFKKGFSLDVLVSKYVMSPGRIYEVMLNVSAVNSGKTIDEKILEDQIRRSCSVQFGENATRLSSPFTWEDMMISPESERLLRLAADRVRFRSTVNEDFGFAKKLPYGRGVAIVFYGPPGTGKTMAAQVLANDLGLDIYRIDLSQVSSKYIGETEKNLGVVFEAAKNSNAILFFDEADSLFSKRTEVSSSNDKYANAETSYLLQKIEEYSGVSVLATNNMQNFDAAFKRRMTFIIPIEAPDEDTRIRLWEAVFPADAPLSSQVDVRILAHVAELTGSSIKSAAVSAAYMAAAAGRKIIWEDLISAVEMEGTKAGTLGLGNRLREAIMTGID
ncbi:MAG: ATP-binding protein [Lachnospiraceae bacterium]|nr:ATP-binding protein [Lachnospiraceae bacterium]